VYDDQSQDIQLLTSLCPLLAFAKPPIASLFFRESPELRRSIANTKPANKKLTSMNKRGVKSSCVHERKCEYAYVGTPWR
jgi:hypothetical protein